MRYYLFHTLVVETPVEVGILVAAFVEVSFGPIVVVVVVAWQPV